MLPNPALRTSRSLLVLALLLSLTLPVGAARAQFSASDLEGTWHVYTRWDAPAGHEAGFETLRGLDIGPTGTIPNGGGTLTTSESGLLIDGVTGGSLTIDAQGLFGGTVEFATNPDVAIDGFQLGVGSTANPSATPPSDLLLGVVTDSEDFVNLSIGVRELQAGFEIGDITGGTMWHFMSHWDQPESGGNDPGWDRGRFRFRPTTGNRAAIDDTTGVDSDGQPLDLDDLEVAVQVDGRVTLLPIVGEFRMSRDKNWMAGVAIDPDGYRSLSVLLRPGGATTQQDLEGTWSWFRFSDDAAANAPRWARGVFVVDALGNVVTGTTERSDGVRDRVVGGSLLVDAFSLEIDGTIDYFALPDDPFVAAQLSIGGNLLAGVASTGTRHGLTLAVPAPEPGFAAGALAGAAGLALAATRRRRMRTPP